MAGKWTANKYINKYVRYQIGVLKRKSKVNRIGHVGKTGRRGYVT